MSFSFLLSQVLGSLSVVCWSCLFIPQIYDNYKRSSTQGLNLSMCFIWCLSGAACAAYLIYEQESVSLVVQFSLMTFGSLLTMGQIFQYDTFRKDGITDYLKTSLLTLFLLVFYVALAAALLALFDYTKNETCVAVLGSIVPSVGFAVGFFPQIYEIIKTKNARGYSAGLSLLDSTGCALASIALLLNGGDPIGIVSYVVIFVFQYVMLLLKLKFPGSTAGKAAVQSGSTDNKAECELVGTTVALSCDIEAKL